MVHKWKDRKRFYTDEAPCESVVNMRHIRLSVHGHVGHGPDEWFASSHGIFSGRRLKSTTIEGAKKEALSYIKAYLVEVAEDLNMVEL